MAYKLLLSVVLCFFVIKATAQKDTMFWFAAPEVSIDKSNFDRPIRFYITTYNKPATVTISQPAGGGMPPQTVVVQPNSSQAVDVTKWIDKIECKPANTVLNYGLKVESNTPVTVYYEIVSAQCLCDPEIFALKGRNALGTDFYIPSQNFHNNNLHYTPTPYNSFDIVATENNTTVTITPSNDIVGHQAGTPFSILLQQGEVYSAAAVSHLAAKHLSGSRVTSNKPIAITEKDDLIEGENDTICADLCGDQIVPVNILGTQYIVVAGSRTQPGENIFITATQNNTTFKLDGVAQGVTLNAGQTYRVPLSATAVYIETSAPAYVMHFSGIGCEYGSAIIPSLKCTGSSNISFVRASFADLFITLLVKNGGQGNFTINGDPSAVNPLAFSVVPGTGGLWYSARLNLPFQKYPPGSPVWVRNSSHLFHLGMMHYFTATGGRYGYFSNFGVIDPEIYTDDSICLADTLLLQTDSLVGATFQWIGPNGASSNLPTLAIPNASLAATGFYTLNVAIDGCSASKAQYATVSNKPTVSMPADDTITCGQTIKLDAYGAPRYLWHPTDYLNDSTGATVYANPTSNTTYVVTGTNNFGCKSSDTMNLHVLDITNNMKLLLCPDSLVMLGDEPITKSGLYVGKFITSKFCDSIVTIDVHFFEKPKADFSFTPTTPVLNEPFRFTNLSEGAVKYTWTFGDRTMSEEENPEHQYIKGGKYNVCLTAINEDGCMDIMCKPVEALVDPVIAVPSAFSPNGDGKNDILYVRGGAVEELHLRIYNRWGQLIFETQSFEKGWDGTFNGEKVNIDVVAYVLHAKFIDGNTYSKSGNITIVK